MSENALEITLDISADQLLAAYGANAVIAVEASATGGGAGYAEVGTVAIVSGQQVYPFYDSNASGTWYRTRYSNAARSNQGAYGQEFQANLPGKTGTSIGSYATVDAVKRRLPLTTTTDDGFLASACNQVNAQIERIVGRPLCPIPTFLTTLSGGVSAGAQSVTLGTTAGLTLGDAILFGPVTGTHEHGYVQAISGTSVTLRSALTNAYADGTAVERVYLFSGHDAVDPWHLQVPMGIVNVTSLEVALFTGDVYHLIPGTNWYLDPPAWMREPGWPFTAICMTDVPTSDNAAPFFIGSQSENSYEGFYDTIRMRGQLGFPTTLDDAVAIAERQVVDMYRSRGSAGPNDTAVLGVDGVRTLAMSLSSIEYKVAQMLRRAPVLLI